MKKLLLLLLLICFHSEAAFFPNSFTTNSPGKFPIPLTQSLLAMYPVTHITTDGIVLDTLAVYYIGSNSFFRGNISANGAIFTNSFQLVSGGGAAKVLTSDANGVGTWAAASGGGGAPANGISPVIALTVTGTNVDASQIDWNATNVCYRLTIATNVFFGDAVCINVPATNNFKWLELDLIQNATGAWTVTFTNSIFAGVNGTFPYTTNANAWDALSLINSRQTNGNVAVGAMNYLHR